MGWFWGLESWSGPCGLGPWLGGRFLGGRGGVGAEGFVVGAASTVELMLYKRGRTDGREDHVR